MGFTSDTHGISSFKQFITESRYNGVLKAEEHILTNVKNTMDLYCALRAYINHKDTPNKLTADDIKLYIDKWRTLTGGDKKSPLYDEYYNPEKPNLSGLDLSGLDLSELDFTGCNFTDANLDNIKFDGSYRMVEGKKELCFTKNDVRGINLNSELSQLMQQSGQLATILNALTMPNSALSSPDSSRATSPMPDEHQK